jgi:tRNA threonylcarbamoyladenosine biosynthesis protein TsaB
LIVLSSRCILLFIKNKLKYYSLKMKILAIETATEACSAALTLGNDCIQRFEVAPRQHTKLILPMIDELLQEADIQIYELDAIAFGQGPGAFTGVRVATGVIQGIAFAHDLPVIPISTLATLAQQFANEHDYVATAIDARMQEVYWGCYKKNNSGLMQPMIEERVCSPTEIPLLSEQSWLGVGTGWETYSEELQAKFPDNLAGVNGDALPRAENVITLAKAAFSEGKAISVEQAAPVYLRNNIAYKN